MKIEALMNKKPHVIIETGTSAWGTESTRFWDAYIRKYGGELWGVDIRPEPKTRLKFQTSPRTHLIVGDSVEFLATTSVKNPTVVFLDSWDVDWSNPKPAAEHGLREFKSIFPKLQPGAFIFIDDTPLNLDYITDTSRARATEYLQDEGVLPGKGAEIVKILAKAEIMPIFHRYSIIIDVHENLGNVI
jgi:cephalosporin hydroxylase